MKLKSLAAAGAALTALALPAAAAAHPNADHRDVASHVRAADRSLDRVERLVGAGAAERALAELRTHRAHLRGALRDARSALRGADGARDLRRVALAYRGIARGQAADAARYTELLGADLPAALQTQLARLLTVSLSEREAVLDRLTALVDELPAASRAGVSRWISRLGDDGQAQVGSLLGLLTAQSGFAPDVQDLLGRALELATGAVENAMARLESIVALLPAQAQAPVRHAIEQIEATLTLVRGMFEALVGTLPAAPGQTPALPDLSALLPGLAQVLPGLGGTLPGYGELLANLTAVLPALQDLLPDLFALPVGGLGDLDGLLEQVTQIVPGLGGLLEGLVGGAVPPAGGGGTGGGTNEPLTGLLDGLLGGLLGGLR